jgi:hypothetical protein
MGFGDLFCLRVTSRVIVAILFPGFIPCKAVIMKAETGLEARSKCILRDTKTAHSAK